MGIEQSQGGHYALGALMNAERRFLEAREALERAKQEFIDAELALLTHKNRGLWVHAEPLGDAAPAAKGA